VRVTALCYKTLFFHTKKEKEKTALLWKPLKRDYKTKYSGNILGFAHQGSIFCVALFFLSLSEDCF